MPTTGLGKDGITPRVWKMKWLFSKMQNLRPGSLKELIHTHINRTSTLCSLPCKQWCDAWFKTMKRSLKAVHLQSQVFQIITAALVKAQNFSREGEKEKKKSHDGAKVPEGCSAEEQINSSAQWHRQNNEDLGFCEFLNSLGWVSYRAEWKLWHQISWLRFSSFHNKLNLIYSYILHKYCDTYVQF